MKLLGVRYALAPAIAVLGVFVGANIGWRWLEPYMGYVVIALYIVWPLRVVYYRRIGIRNGKLLVAERILMGIGGAYLAAKYSAIAMSNSPCLALMLLSFLAWPIASRLRRAGRT